MSIQYILFDLDGTLLPMDQDAFTRRYFGLLAHKLAPLGYDPDRLIEALWMGVRAMVKNDGSCTNEQAFWTCFASLLGEHVRNDIPVFDNFYRNEFIGAKEACGFNAKAAEAVKLCLELGFKVALATNPLFPAIATENRIIWAGLKPEDFEFYTTYENSTHCKPNPDYYRDVAAKLGADLARCLMVGNDADEDMAAASSIGMRAFLLTDCLINKSGWDYSGCPHGNFDDLIAHIRSLA